MSTGQGRRRFNGLVLAGGGLALAGCVGTMGTMRKLAGEVAPTVADALALYGIARGVAEVAVVAEPALAPLVAALVAIADPLMARLQQAQADTAAAAQLEAQAKALLLRTASVVHVLPNAPLAAGASG